MATLSKFNASSASSISAALASWSEDVAKTLLGEPSSRSPREWRWGSRGSLALSLSGPKRGLWFDHERGEGGDLLDLISRERCIQLGDAIRVAQSEFLSNSEIQSPPQRRPEPSPSLTNDVVESRIRAAMRVWHETVPIADTSAECYLVRHRSLDVRRLNLDHSIRWHAGSRAVIALMTDPITSEPVGIHRTFLDARAAKIERKMLGRQGVVRLTPNSEVTTGVGITEGVEDGLAVLLSGWAPVWAATSASAIARFPVLPGVQALTIFADADTPGIQAANTSAARWRLEGHDARVSRPAGELAHV